MTWLSYIFTQTIYATTTSWGAALSVREVRGKSKLVIGGVEQSGQWYRSLWGKVIQAVSPRFRDKSARTLVLGLGGGDLVHVLLRRYPHTAIVAVEHERVIMQVATKYFRVPVSPLISLVYDDANSFVMRAKPKVYSLVLVDLYDADYIPPFVTNPKFLTRLSYTTKAGGIVVINYSSRACDTIACNMLEEKLKGIFAHVDRLPLLEHTFFIASKRTST